MIDPVDDHLVHWVDETLGPANISLYPPQKTAEGQGISLYLLALAEYPPLQGVQRAPLQFWRRYLVTAWAEEPAAEHALLCQLLLAAMDTPEYEVELEPISPTLWIAFGIPPRPAFILRVPVRQERPQRMAPRVREPLGVRWIKPVRFNGVVYGPGDSPLPGVRVALLPESGSLSPALEAARQYPAVLTDGEGRFTFSSVPDQPSCTLYIQIKDQEVFASLERSNKEDELLVLRWDLLSFQAFTGEGKPAAGGLVRFSREDSAASGRLLVCEAGQEPLPGLRLEYLSQALSAPLDHQGQGWLLLQEKALGQASRWLPELCGSMAPAGQHPRAGAKIDFPSLNLSGLTDDQGTFKLK